MSFVTWYNEMYIESTCLLFCFDGLTLRTTIVELTLIEVKRTMPKLSKIVRSSVMLLLPLFKCPMSHGIMEHMSVILF
jgi:hypothetical protein